LKNYGAEIPVHLRVTGPQPKNDAPEPQKMPFSLGLINKLESDLSKFIEWGKSKGIKFEGSRVLKYIELLGAYRDALQQNEIDDLIKSRGAEYLDQIPHEIAALVYLYESLRTFKDQRLTSRFQCIIQGPELLEDDVTGSSRDTQFELEIAALLFRAKINELRFDSRHDLVCSLLHNPLIIECKRPRKNKTLRDVYASGAHQIESSTRIEENPDTKGIVALDLTQVIFPSLKGSRYKSINEMQDAFTHAFVKKWYRLQITISDYSDRVSALHLFCGAPFYLEIAGSYVSLPTQKQQNLIVINAKDYQKNHKIAYAYRDFLTRVSNTYFPPKLAT
jgi:hypothetical protein